MSLIGYNLLTSKEIHFALILIHKWNVKKINSLLSIIFAKTESILNQTSSATSSFMLSKPIFFLILLNSSQKSGLTNMKPIENLRVSTNLTKKFEPKKKVGFLRKFSLNIFRKTDAILLI